MKPIKLVLALGCIALAWAAGRGAIGLYVHLMDASEERTPYMFGIFAGTGLTCVFLVFGAYMLCRSAMHGRSQKKASSDAG